MHILIISSTCGTHGFGLLINCFQISLGLEYLHHKHVIYKDLKPANVLVWSLDEAADVNVKLSDYGLSSFATPQGSVGYMGTVGYQAPEMRKGHTYTEKVMLLSI